MNKRSPSLVSKIVSGGQTGVDRGALRAAVKLGIAHGGWCPKGRLAEDGRIPDEFELQETQSRKYNVRTKLNVTDSDGTLILFREKMTGGTTLTFRIATQYDKPLKCIDFEATQDLDDVRDWLVDEKIETLNVAGPRESGAEGIETQTQLFLQQLFEAD